jgi:hypothetical protein
MADESISDLTTTAVTAGGYIEISLPDGGGWKSRRISHDDFLAILNTYKANSTQTLKLKIKSADFTQNFNADTKIESIDIIWVSGTSVSVKVGTAALGTDIISGRTITSSKNSANNLSDYFGSAVTLYFTISGGAVDIIINYRNNYNS